MLLGRNKEKQPFHDMIDGKLIESSLKLLGVTLDGKLSYNVGKLVLVRLRKLIPTKAKLQLYQSAILPNLAYCHTVWHFCSASDARKLERMQERALRAVYTDRTTTPIKNF